MVLRAVFPVFRRFLIPACIIGGTIGLVCQSTGLLALTGFPLDIAITQNAVFHLFNLTWVYIALRMPDKTDRTAGASAKLLGWSFGAITFGSYLTMGVGILTTTVLAFIGLNSGPGSLGFLTAYGFVAGPGQAFTIGTVWGNVSEYTGLPDFALAGGAVGYAVAIICGIILVNIIGRKKKMDFLACPNAEEECGFYGECTPKEEAGTQTTSSTSIDVLAWHLALGIFIYLLVFAAAVGLSKLLPQSLTVILWGLFFMFVAAGAACIRTILIKIGKSHLLCNGINSRIQNTLVDYLVCATFMSIVVGNITQYIIPFFVSSLACALSVGIFAWMITRRRKEEGLETFCYLFGNLTGTVSTSLVLLRLVDPNAKSQVALRFAYSSILAVPCGIISAFMYNMEMIYGGSPLISGILLIVYACVFGAIALFFRQPTNPKAWQPDEVKE